MKKSFVAMFHVIKDQEWFEQTIVHLMKHYRMIDANELYDSLTLKNFNNSTCHVSFDDGHISFYRKALPVLVKYRVPATLFISPKLIANGEAYWFQKIDQLPEKEFNSYLCSKLKEMYPVALLQSSSNSSILKTLPYSIISALIDDYAKMRGVSFAADININLAQLKEIVSTELIEIGAHTLNHPILANETDDNAKIEIEKSVEQTEVLTGKKVQFFACPNGIKNLDFGHREEAIMRNCGVRMNASTKIDYLTDRYGLLCVPRIGLTKGDTKYINKKIRYAKQWELLRHLSGKSHDLKQRLKLYSAQSKS